MKTTALLVLAFASAAISAFAQDEAVTIRLKGNRITKVTVTRLTPNSLGYQITRSRTEAHIPYSEIVTIEWPEPEPWKQAMEHFYKMEYAEAESLFEQFTRAPQRLTHHPAPGNFNTRAKRMLLEIHRIEMNGKALAPLLQALQPEISLLPPDEQWIPPGVQGWIAVAKEAWSEVEQIASDNPLDTEVAYLAGLAHLENGNKEAADVSFTRAYTLDIAGNTRIAREALRQSIEINPTSPKVHTYATLFGKGKLWDNASSPAASLLAEPLKAGRPVLGEDEGAGDPESFDSPEANAERVEKID